MDRPGPLNELIALLKAVIPPDDPNRERIFTLINITAVTPKIISAFEEMNDTVVLRAKRLYLRCRTNRNYIPPTLPELILWLQGQGGMEYAAFLEKKLALIKQQLDLIGLTPHTGIVKVPADLVLTLRMIILSTDLADVETNNNSQVSDK